MLPRVMLTVRYANMLYKNRSFLSSSVCSNEARLMHLHALILNLFLGFYWVVVKGEIEGAITRAFRLITARALSSPRIKVPSTHCWNNAWSAWSQFFLIYLFIYLFNLFYQIRAKNIKCRNLIGQYWAIWWWHNINIVINYVTIHFSEISWLSSVFYNKL